MWMISQVREYNCVQNLCRVDLYVLPHCSFRKKKDLQNRLKILNNFERSVKPYRTRGLSLGILASSSSSY